MKSNAGRPIIGLGEEGYAKSYGVPRRFIRGIGIARFSGWNDERRKLVVNEYLQAKSRSIKQKAA